MRLCRRRYDGVCVCAQGALQSRPFVLAVLGYWCTLNDGGLTSTVLRFPVAFTGHNKKLQDVANKRGVNDWQPATNVISGHARQPLMT